MLSSDKTVISICRRIPTKSTNGNGKPIFVKVVKYQTKMKVMSSEECPKDQRVPVNINDVVAAIRRRDDISGFHLANDKIILPGFDNQKHVFQNHFDLYKLDPNFVLPLCKYYLNL